MHRPHVASGGRYPVLRALAILQLVGAFLVGIGGVIGSIYAATSWGGHVTSFGDKAIIVLGGLATTFFLVVFTLAFAELIKLLIDIEHNTRMAGVGMNGQASTPVGAGATSGEAGRVNRIAVLEEESAEAALIRGH